MTEFPFQFQLSNKGDECEDAPLPLVADERFSIVCDGLGGDGMTLVTKRENMLSPSETHTSAYFGSRMVAECVADYYKRNYDKLYEDVFRDGNPKEKTDPIKDFVTNLKSAIQKKLDGAAKNTGVWKMAPVSGKQFKKFPTTLSSALYFPVEQNLYALLIWAGDSRTYVLSANGLQVLTQDDADSEPGSMTSSSTMNNCICAERPFHLNFALYDFNSPAFLFCCTDGCTDQWPSPLHFEWLLMNILFQYIPDDCEPGQVGQTFADQVRDNLYQRIYDDTTMAGLAVNMPKGSGLKLCFQERWDQINLEAPQMRDYVSELKEIRQKNETAAKTQRLYSHKVDTAMRETVRNVLEKRDQSKLYAFLRDLPCMEAYRNLEEKIARDLQIIDEALRREKEEREKRSQSIERLLDMILIWDYGYNHDVLPEPDYSSMLFFINFNWPNSSEAFQPLYEGLLTILHEKANGDFEQVKNAPDCVTFLKEAKQNKSGLHITETAKRKLDEWREFQKSAGDLESELSGMREAYQGRHYKDLIEEVLPAAMDALYDASEETLRNLFQGIPELQYAPEVATAKQVVKNREATEMRKSELERERNALWEKYRPTYERFGNTDVKITKI